MKKTVSIILAIALTLSLVLSFASCGQSSSDDKKTELTVAVPNDTTNEARALLLLQEQGLIKLKDGAGITATVLDIEEIPTTSNLTRLRPLSSPMFLRMLTMP